MQVSRWNGSRQYFFRKWALFDVQKKGFLSAGPISELTASENLPQPQNPVCDQREHHATRLQVTK
jgi:hypothetical protein